MYYVINSREHIELMHRGMVSTRLASYWRDLLSKLPEELRHEADLKSFQLRPHPLLENERTRYSYNLMFYVPNATPLLMQELQRAEFVVICLHED